MYVATDAEVCSRGGVCAKIYENHTCTLLLVALPFTSLI